MAVQMADAAWKRYDFPFWFPWLGLNLVPITWYKVSGIARVFPVCPPGRTKMWKKIKKIWGKMREPTGKWGQIEEIFLSCPPGSERLATALYKVQSGVTTFVANKMYQNYAVLCLICRIIRSWHHKYAFCSLFCPFCTSIAIHRLFGYG